MGAAAVFETAAETPPTDKGLATAVQTLHLAQQRDIKLDRQWLSIEMKLVDGDDGDETYSRSRPRSPGSKLASDESD
jgi:hypothetical protein